MRPAINVARYGFPVTQDLVYQMDTATADQANFLVEDPTWAIDFAPNGTRLGLGDILTRKRYADTLANSTLYFVVGAAGGSRIITAAIQTLWHVLDHNFTTHEALSEPRLHDQLIPNQVQFEYAYDNMTVAFMEGRGHSVTWIPLAQSAVHALRRLSNGTFEAAGDPRLHASAGYTV